MTSDGLALCEGVRMRQLLLTQLKEERRQPRQLLLAQS